MKFYVESLSKLAPRIGFLKDIEGKATTKIKTPFALLHTQGGQVPHITHEVFRLISKEPKILQIPLVNMHVYQEVLDDFQGTLSEFVGSKDSISCLTLHDPIQATTQGHHLKDQVPVWTRQGKVMYNPDSYMHFVETLKPDMYYLLSDGDTNKTSSNKRTSKSVENTLYFFKECMEIQRKSTKLNKSFVMAPIAGGYSLNARKKCIEGILEDCSGVSGYLIDGLHNNGPEVELLTFEEVQPIVELIINNIPPESIRSVQGCWNPLNVIGLVKLGIDMFDTSYCQLVTERYAAMTFGIEPNEDTSSFEVNLQDFLYCDHFEPILQNCTCLTCTKYTKAYIYHLITAEELLGPILLMIHNVHHYLRFFNYIQKCVEDNTLNEFESRLKEQYEQFKANSGKVVPVAAKKPRRISPEGDV